MVTQRTSSDRLFTADQVIDDYYKLSTTEQEKVRKELRLAIHSEAESEEKYGVTPARNDTFLSKSPTENHLGALEVGKESIDQWPFFDDKVWQLQALVGEDIVYQAMKANGGRLKGALMLALLQSRPMPFYINEQLGCLSMGTSELMERDFGPLQPISAVDAVQRFGLAKLEEASERGYIII